MRLFFGLELPAATVLQIADWRDRELHCDGRPVPPENFHITLAFIGEVSARNLEPLLQNVDEALSGSHKLQLELQLDQVGYWQKQGIYWLGSSTTPAPLNTLASKLRSVAASNGGRLEKKAFVPHITLFRRCDTPPPAPPSVPEQALSWEHFTLFESVQGRRGVRYQALEHWPLP